eukprot:scaffold36813_cov66-Attheya_sp.AAC.3
MKRKWEELCAISRIDPSINEGWIISMDDTLLYAILSENAFIIVPTVCTVARKVSPYMEIEEM